MRILDKYIFSKYIKAVFFTLFIFIPIAVVIDVAEKVDKFLRHDDLTFIQIIKDYYVNFVLYYGNTFLPLATFIACIMFTSKMANNTEVVAISSANISFTRFLRPFFMAATFLALIAFATNHFILPKANGTRIKFENDYIKKKSGYDKGFIRNFNLQLNDSSKVFIKNFSLQNNKGYNFSYAVFDGIKLKYKVTASTVVWRDDLKKFQLKNYTERKIFAKQDSIFEGKEKDIEMDFTPSDLSVMGSKSMEMTSFELWKFIKKSERRGIKNLNAYYIELHQRTSLPVSAYILTLIAVALASRKKRGGTGINLAIGIGLMFMYVFFMKVAQVLGSTPNSSPFIMAWLPNIVFSAIAIYLYLQEKKRG